MANTETGPGSQAWFEQHFGEIDSDIGLDPGYAEQVYGAMRTTAHNPTSLVQAGYKDGDRVLAALVTRGLVMVVQEDFDRTPDGGLIPLSWWKACE